MHVSAAEEIFPEIQDQWICNSKQGHTMVLVRDMITLHRPVHNLKTILISSYSLSGLNSTSVSADNGDKVYETAQVASTGFRSPIQHAMEHGDILNPIGNLDEMFSSTFINRRALS